jgi:hypothetical protein
MEKKIAQNLKEAVAIGPAETANLIRNKLCSMQIMIGREFNLSLMEEAKLAGIINVFMGDLGMSYADFPALKESVEKERAS